MNAPRPQQSTPSLHCFAQIHVSLHSDDKIATSHAATVQYQALDAHEESAPLRLCVAVWWVTKKFMSDRQHVVYVTGLGAAVPVQSDVARRKY
jgi:hypothetical protein